MSKRTPNRPTPQPTASKPAAVAPPVVVETSVAIPRKPLPRSVLLALAIVGIVVALIPVWNYYQTVWKQAFNYPFEDDFNSLLTFINAYTDPAATVSGRLGLLTAQHNEHRILFDRLVFLAQYYLQGTINIRTLILIGNVSLLLLTSLLFMSSLRRYTLPERVLLFVPVTYILFTFHFWELTVWGMASIQNLYVLVFVLASLFLLCQQPATRASFVWACGLAVLATYTSGNGLFVFPVGGLVLAILRNRTRLLIWGGVGVAVAVLYFMNFTRSEGLPNVYESLVGNTSRAIDYFFTLTGSVISADPAYPARAGKLMLLTYLGLMGYLVVKKQLRTYLPMAALLTFLYVTFALLTATRSGFGVAQAYSPRYGILSVLLLASLGLLLLDVIGRFWLRTSVGVAFAGLALWIFTVTDRQNRVKIDDRARLLQFCAAFYNDDPKNLLVYWGTSQEEGKAILAESFRRKTYQIPPVTFANLTQPPVPMEASQLVASTDVMADVKPFESHGYVVVWNSWALINGIPSDGVQTSLVARSDAGAFEFPTGKHVRYDVVNQFQSMAYMASGLSGVIRKADLKPGRYTIWLHLTDGKVHSYFPINQGFEV